ncbi:hypothetical protein C4D60_Mb08t00420 [Musa balbisiana]|uniref:DUF3700 domain-containing protein n=1 Tax=Musa balbisiana TaxID=52838 RepID=A0A4S8K0F3_MUSBA|nr:hypothetical protein C4D60_Mb08t00420 [Musa balbisiana]
MFAAKDEIYCLFEGVLTNLGSLRQQYGLLGLSKSANEVVLVMEAYKALRDRAPYPPSFMLAHLSGNFAFVLFDKSTSSILVASGSCGKSLAPFPKGCYYSNALGGLKSYENPKHKVTAVLENEEEVCGATFKVEGSAVVAATQ